MTSTWSQHQAQWVHLLEAAFLGWISPGNVPNFQWTPFFFQKNRRSTTIESPLLLKAKDVNFGISHRPKNNLRCDLSACLPRVSFAAGSSCIRCGLPIWRGNFAKQIMKRHQIQLIYIDSYFQFCSNWAVPRHWVSSCSVDMGLHPSYFWCSFAHASSALQIRIEFTSM